MKKGILKFLVVILSICALVGIFFIFKVGTLSTLELRLLGTAGTIFVFSTFSFFSSLIINNDEYKSFSKIGIGVSLLTMLWVLLVVWGVIDVCFLNCSDSSTNLEVTLSLVLLSIFVAYSSLVLLIKNDVKIIKIIQTSIITIALLNNALIIVVLWKLLKYSDIYYKISVSLGIIVSLGTVVLLILSKMNKKDDDAIPIQTSVDTTISNPNEIVSTITNNIEAQPTINTQNNGFGNWQTVTQQNNGVFSQPTVNNVPNNNIGIPSVNSWPQHETKQQETKQEEPEQL